ncbi:MAG: hypothetical protein GX199_04395 [Firmicutes bacterium]|nr:hypothetical protein [Bacillota bacterium]
MAEQTQALVDRLARLEARLAWLEANAVPRAELDRVVAEHQKDILALVMLISTRTREGRRLDHRR